LTGETESVEGGFDVLFCSVAEGHVPVDSCDAAAEAVIDQAIGDPARSLFAMGCVVSVV
jgi:hypothetical protein